MIVKKIVFLVFVIIAIFVISELTHSIYNLWQKSDLLISARDELDKQKNKNSKLREKINIVTKPDFIEEEARNKLFMSRQGEQIVIVAPTDIKKKDTKTYQKKDNRPNWRQWMDLFFKF